jgi:hypothetical protein
MGTEGLCLTVLQFVTFPAYLRCLTPTLNLFLTLHLFVQPGSVVYHPGDVRTVLLLSFAACFRPADHLLCLFAAEDRWSAVLEMWWAWRDDRPLPQQR